MHRAWRGWRRAALAVSAALALTAAAGCQFGGSRPVTAEQANQELFRTLETLETQASTITDTDKRDQILGTVGTLRNRMLFSDLKMPSAARLLLAQGIDILPTTRVIDSNNDGTPDGFEVLVEARDHFGDPTKVVGTFIFELFSFRPARGDPRSLTRVAYWNQPVETAEDSARFWNRFDQSYRFILAWKEPPAVGQKFIFQATYVTPWGETMQAQRKMTRMPDEKPSAGG